MTQSYEYLVVAGDSSYLRSHTATAKKHTAQLTELAAEGWELTSTSAMEAVGFTIAVLAKVPGSLVTQAELLEQVWGPGYEGESEYLRTLFARLRRKLEVEPSRPRHLITEPGIGYRLEMT